MQMREGLTHYSKSSLKVYLVYRHQLNVHAPHGLVVRVKVLVLEGHGSFDSIAEMPEPDGASDVVRVREPGEDSNPVLVQVLEIRYRVT